MTIQLWYNPSELEHEVYLNGVKADGIVNIKTETQHLGDMPKASITAMVEIVNTKPEQK